MTTINADMRTWTSAKKINAVLDRINAVTRSRDRGQIAQIHPNRSNPPKCTEIRTYMFWRDTSKKMRSAI